MTEDEGVVLVETTPSPSHLVSPHSPVPRSTSHVAMNMSGVLWSVTIPDRLCTPLPRTLAQRNVFLRGSMKPVRTG